MLDISILKAQLRNCLIKKLHLGLVHEIFFEGSTVGQYQIKGLGDRAFLSEALRCSLDLTRASLECVADFFHPNFLTVREPNGARRVSEVIDHVGSLIPLPKNRRQRFARSDSRIGLTEFVQIVNPMPRVRPTVAVLQFQGG